MQNTNKDGLTRIQLKNRKIIEDAALDVFSAEGFRGSTLDQIAVAAGMSKPNILYYYPNKEAIYSSVLNRILATWLEPLRRLDPEGEPMAEILGYVQAKIKIAQDFPQESRLFANEMIRGAPQIQELLHTELRELVRDKAAVLQMWMDQGRLKPVHPYHLIFSIWSMTQHYADFDVQVRAILGDEPAFPAASDYIETLISGLAPDKTVSEGM